MKKLTLALFIAFSTLFIFRLAMANLTLAQEPWPKAKTTTLTPTVQIPADLLPKIEPALLKKLLPLTSTNAPMVPFIAHLKAKADLAPVSAMANSDPLSRRVLLVDRLQQTARTSQADVLAMLRPANLSGLSGTATDIRPLWIINAIAAKGTLETVLALAARPDIEIVRLDKEIHLDLTPHPSLLTTDSAPLTNWGIAKIRADFVHDALGINGAGVVVANVDTGVEWYHPALRSKYRGYAGPGHDDLAQHLGNWYDALEESTYPDGVGYPTDGSGHGTHTMGTIVGDNIGVAPGAKWIAVKAFNSKGSGQDSSIHAAFQWLLSPNGAPALAPNVVNNSWSNNQGDDTEFLADLQALNQAGIYVVFSAGNEGPAEGSVGSPAALPIAFAVGATDINDDLTNFSGRGPSYWDKIKPEISAPGKDILSTFPGGAYTKLDGTSMAAPHVAGVAALLLQASPALSQNLSKISYILTSTAVPLGNSTPNNGYGWGRIDAYNAVMSVLSRGALQGVVLEKSVPLPYATIRITPRSGGATIQTTTDANGFYAQNLAANTYDVSVLAFGYLAATEFNLKVTDKISVTQNFNLEPQPQGTLMGQVKSVTKEPLSATITINNTPLRPTTSLTDGSYRLNLPIGVYTVTVAVKGYQLGHQAITISDGLTTKQDFWLAKTPRILLIDSGRWMQESKISYYQQSLDDLLYPYDFWQITQPFTAQNDIPTITLLSQYDVVIWSAPTDAPGYLGADEALTKFLKQGGRLLLSGQDVAYFDGGNGFFNTAQYLNNYLKTDYIEDNAYSYQVAGTGLFAGLSLNIRGGDGANNQKTPDVIAVADHDSAEPLFYYKTMSGTQKMGGVQVGLCLPYRAIFLAFGFEAINTRADRNEVMRRAIDWLKETPYSKGIELTSIDSTLIGNFGDTVSHAARLRNIGTATDTYRLTLTPGEPYDWPTSFNEPTLTLSPCSTRAVTIGVQVNTSAWDISDTFKLTVQSMADPSMVKTITRTTKSPAPVLLVDDDVFYDFAPEYKTALDLAQIPYDYWNVQTSGSPPLATLKIYPMVLWYTAYDWTSPLTTAEEERLANYLDGGGRFFFSSQDYIYNLPNHKPSVFAKAYLGVQKHTEDYSSTLIMGQDNSPVGAYLGPYPLTFPRNYNNWTDAIWPSPTALTATVGQAGQANGLTNAGFGMAGEQWHTVYLAFGPEVLPPTARTRLLQRSVGWLSWLGRSTLTSSATTAVSGDRLAYTLTVINDGLADLPAVQFTAEFPPGFMPHPDTPELTLSDNRLMWQGALSKNQRKEFHYTAIVGNDAPLGMTDYQTTWLTLPNHKITFDRQARVAVNYPDVRTSSFTVEPSRGIVVGDVLNYAVILRNTSAVNLSVVTVTNTLPPELNLVWLNTPATGRVVTTSRSFTWKVPLPAYGQAVLTYQARVEGRSGNHVRNSLKIEDGVSVPMDLTASALFKDQIAYLPVIMRD